MKKEKITKKFRQERNTGREIRKEGKKMKERKEKKLEEKKNYLLDISVTPRKALSNVYVCLESDIQEKEKRKEE